MQFETLGSTERGTLLKSLRESAKLDCAGAVPAENKPGALPEPNGHIELRRQMLTYGQRYDTQTGLLNYRAFQDGLKSLLRGRLPGQEFALIWVDVLNLRREFSLWGSKGPEALVRHVADALRTAVNPDVLLGRFSGRCFLIAMPAAKFDRGDKRRIQRVVDALGPMRLFGSEIKPELAAGVAFYPTDTGYVDDLMRFASLAAARAGYTKSSNVLTFNASMNNMIMRDHQLEVEMHRGLDRGQFRVFYQPKVDLATGQVLGAEALMRWNHPEWGPVATAEFIPIAERSRLIQRIFDFSLRTALKDAQRWSHSGFTLPAISVNASAVNISGEDFARSVNDILSEIPIAPTELELEVTESMLLEDEELFSDRVRQLKAIGAHIAIDDFGTRYTGFKMLRELPLNAMKIDRCFIHGIDRSADMRALCETIEAMARQLNLRTVAEGIEEPGELEVMREIGCDAGQGFLFQRPMPAEDFLTFLHDWPERMHTLGFVDGHHRHKIGPLAEVH
jgi:EAL domain-containing protein (putative c-di-GMP-specific phosphodiesterase class I)/GGDEF domain-containing protein